MINGSIVVAAFLPCHFLTSILAILPLVPLPSLAIAIHPTWTPAHIECCAAIEVQLIRLMQPTWRCCKCSKQSVFVSE
jgi:hypothetical protein